MKRTVQKLSSVILTAVLVLSLLPLNALAAASGDYVYSVVNGKAIITKYTGKGGAVTIPSTLGGYPVTVIGDSAFASSALTSVVIPSVVTNIGDSAFLGCEGLKSVTIPDGVVSIEDAVFAGCMSLSSVAIPGSVTSIGSSVFLLCSSLSSVSLPDSVTRIGGMAFAGCTELKSIHIPSKLVGIKDGTFMATGLTSVTIPANITRIGSLAFALSDTLTSVTIPGSVTAIVEDAFAGSSKLASIQVDASSDSYASQDGVLFNKAKTTLILYPIGNARTSYTTPQSVTSIGNGAFAGSGYLTRVTLTSGVTGIGDSAFEECSRLASVTIPGSVTRIGESAFASCSRLASFQVAASNSNYASQDGVLFNKANTRLIQYPAGNSRSSYTVPGSVTRIVDSAFDSSNHLTSVTIPGSVTAIEDWAFVSCENLEKAYFLGNAPAMGYAVFDGCSLDFTVVYVQGKKGFTDPWYDYPTTAYAVPAAPNVKAATAGYDSVKLTWAAVAGADGYEVYRAASSTDAYTKIATITGGSKAGYTDTGLTTGATYYYRVRAYRAMGSNKLYSISSAVASAKPGPMAPSVKASSAGYNSVKLTWSAVSGTTKYEVYRATSSNGTYTKLTETASTSYTSTGLTTGTTYYYKVKTYRLAGSAKMYSGYSATVSAKPVPAAPTGIKADQTAARSVKVSWNAVPGASGYEVFRAMNGGAYAPVKATTALSLTNTGLATGKVYTYRVKAYRLVNGAKVYGGYSEVVTAKT